MVNLKNIGDAKHFSPEDIRFATPIEVARYRARRLSCKVIVDLCSGIGVQTAEFSKTCSKVYGFEIDERKVEYAKKNFGSISNLVFETGDVLSPEVIQKVSDIKPDIIFCDPERLPSEKERNLDSIKPDVRRLLEVYSKITPNICLEIPPRIDSEKLTELGKYEREYLSFNNKLNRLDLYFGKIKKNEVSVCDVSTGNSIVNNPKRKAEHTRNVSSFLYEVSEAVVKAELTNEISILSRAEILDGSEKNKVLLTSKNPSVEFFSLAKPYQVIIKASSQKEINNLLKVNKFGKVLIKYSIDPKDYWKERNLLEKGLFGSREAVVFLVNHEYLLCEEYN